MDLKTLVETPSWEWPEGAHARILAVLRDRSAKPADRLLAAELGGDLVVMDDDLGRALLDLVQAGDQPEELRATAAISLSAGLEQADTFGFDDPEDVPFTALTFKRVQETFRAIHRDATAPVLVRRRVLEASVRAPQKWHVEAVRTAWAGDAAWRLTAVFCMRFVKGFDAEILAALDSPDADVRYHAIQAAANWEVDKAWGHVTAILRSGTKDKALLLAAIDAVGCIRPREAPTVLAPLMDSRDEDIQDAIGIALAMNGDLGDAGDDDADA